MQVVFHAGWWCTAAQAGESWIFGEQTLIMGQNARPHPDADFLLYWLLLRLQPEERSPVERQL